MWLFSSARIRLTLLYLFTTALISGAFSILLYRVISQELERSFRAFELRSQMSSIFIQRNVLEEDLEEAKRALARRILYMNGFILTGAGLAGYFLADKTLRPIEEIYKNQKRFIGDASHELRTPLTVLRSEIEVSLRDKNISTKETKAILNSNLDEVIKMQNLVNYLLELNRYETGTNISKEKTNISVLTKNVIKKLKNLADQKKLVVKSNFKTVQASVDPTSFEQLVTILLDNAIKYSEKGVIKIFLARKGRSLEFSVTDNGIGIAKNDLDKIFDRFYRSDISRTKDSKEGYGLGLSIAKSIVDLHGGEIWVKSKPGFGSTFFVKIPLAS